jgi:hypothetical protein
MPLSTIFQLYHSGQFIFGGVNWSAYKSLFLVDAGAVVVIIVWWLYLQLPMQSVPITTKVVSSKWCIC